MIIQSVLIEMNFMICFDRHLNWNWPRENARQRYFVAQSSQVIDIATGK